MLELDKLLPRYISLISIFGNTNPIEIEIGCGKGRFIVELADRFPKINFLGLDRAGKWMKKGESKRERRNLRNLKFIKCEAKEFLREYIASGSVDTFYIYFPDPWPKQRHRERRIFEAEFLHLLHEKLIASGVVDIATDDEEYFNAIAISIRTARIVWSCVEESVNQRITHAEVCTNYEAKYRNEGRNIYYLRLQK